MSIIITFIPENKNVPVVEGTLLSDAAVMAGISSLHLPCNGSGTCNKCYASVKTASDETPRTVLSCKYKVNENITVQINPAHSSENANLHVVSPLNKQIWGTEKVIPLAYTAVITVPEPTEDDNYSDFDRLKRQLKTFCGPGMIHCTLNALQSLSSSVRENNGTITVYIYTDKDGHHIFNIKSSMRTNDILGLACDIGSTSIAMHLVNLSDGKIINTKTDYNAQITRGSEISARIEHAKTSVKLEELRTLVLQTINHLITELVTDSKISLDSIFALSITGNTTMIHLFLGLSPKYIKENPFVPTITRYPIFKAKELELEINPEAPVFISSGIGSNIGGDITSGLLCTDLLYEKETVSLFIDIGTNVEIVIGNYDFLVSSSCSCGSVFEGSVVTCGMRATSGAIESLSINPSDLSFIVKSAGNDLPIGICGSGLISIAGELLKNGLIDHSGKFTKKAHSHSNYNVELKAIVLVNEASTNHGRPIYITESDIDALIRTKAAVYANCELILNNIGLDFASINSFIIAGNLGEYINIENAILIGLFPNIARSKFVYIGNAALAGATLSLMSDKFRDRVLSLSRKITYCDLNADPRYIDVYMSALTLPFSDPDISVKNTM
jgi:uncharacterized 2Fe-2S/4Fe-4S cluster protein (DUF4445 family)